jgi:hypothetical protein
MFDMTRLGRVNPLFEFGKDPEKPGQDRQPSLRRLIGCP